MINKKIKNLTKIFFRDYSEKLNILKNNKIDKKSSLFWTLLVLIFCIAYLSVYVISRVSNSDNPEIVLKAYLPIVTVVICFQLIIIVCNMLYYSKDLEYILPLPIKPIEILMAKLFSIIGIMYLTEMVFLVIPLLTYWWFVAGTIRFLIYMIFVLAIFPIVFTLIIGSIIILLMQLFKKLKNENMKQLLIMLSLTICLMGFVFFIINHNLAIMKNTENIEIINENLTEINQYFIITNPIIELLTEKNWINNIINILKIIFIEGILFGIIYLLGKKLYYNNLLNIYKKNTKKIQKKYEYIKTKKEKSYFKNEVRKLFRNSTYFSQVIYNFINIIIISLVLISVITPMLVQETHIEDYEINSLKIQIFSAVLIAIQVIATFNNLAITAISKEGREAVFMKYIPLPLYKQFKIKVIPQIVLNTIMIISVLVVIGLNVPQISIWYYIIAFITAFILNIIYSILLLLLDCKNPNLNWINQESVVKGGNNKIYKYFITIIFVLIIFYFSSIFEKMNFAISVILINLILIICLIILMKYIKKNINKIFNKIY